MRSKKLCSIDVDEKLTLGRELRQMDREQDRLEAELNRHQDREVLRHPDICVLLGAQENICQT